MADTLELRSNLTEKQAAWAEHYVQCQNGTTAARRAGYQGPDGTLAHRGSMNKKKAKIRKYLRALVEERHMDTHEALALLADQARGSMRPFIEITSDGHLRLDLDSREARDMLHVIKELKIKTESRVTESGKEIEDQHVTVKLYDAQKAAIEILKLAGQYDEEGQTINVQVNSVVQQTYQKLGIDEDGMGVPIEGD